MNKMIKVFHKRKDIDCTYDDRTDTLTISQKKSQKSSTASTANIISMQIGAGLTIDYDETHGEIIALTLTGLLEKVLTKMGKDIISISEEKKLAKAASKVAEEEQDNIKYGKQKFDQGGEA